MDRYQVAVYVEGARVPVRIVRPFATRESAEGRAETLREQARQLGRFTVRVEPYRPDRTCETCPTC